MTAPNTILAHLLTITWQVAAIVVVLLATIALILSTRSRHRLQRALESNRRDQARLRTLLTQMPCVLWTTDTDLRVTSSEGAALKDVGLRPGQVVGLTLREYFQTDDPNYTPLRIHLDALAGHTGNYEVEYGVRTYLVHCEPLRDPGGQVTGTITAALDITDVKLAQRNLARSQARNQALLQAIPDVMFRMTRSGRLVEFIDKLMAPADYFGKSVLDVFPPAVAQRFLAAAARALDTRRGELLEYQTGDGDAPRFFEARLVNCCDDEVLVILRNITERRRAEDDLRRRESELRALVRAIPDLIFQLTPDARFAGCLASNPDDLLMSPDQFLGRPIYDVLPPHVAALVGKHLRAAVQTGQPQVLQYALDMPGGDTRWFEARLVWGGDGSDLVTALVRNITDVRTRSYIPAVAVAV